MNYIKELMIEHDLSSEEATEYLLDMADRLKDEAKYSEGTNNEIQ